MILSMTGYGKAVVVFEGKKITAEIKSLNSKSLDLSTRITPIYREKEMEIRNMIATNLERGKVEFNLWAEKSDSALSSPINGAMAENYHKQIRHICEEYGIPEPQDWWALFLRMPDVLTRDEVVAELSEQEWEVVKKAIEDSIAQLMASIEPFEKGRTEKIRQRIIDNLESIKGVEYDRNRLEQEMIYYIEKLDINEEKQRLTNHLAYFRETMQNGHGQGKKLGFIAQEMGREINTTGSKSNEAEMQNIVVRMKDELEQIKEQVLNVM